ncbi:MAG TPA: tyrosine-type recombinase/integrase [Dehalococcoidia bacterium]|nr:tyrosine-type recombinase/integrase [Dehalococcoidia bacterium]
MIDAFTAHLDQRGFSALTRTRYRGVVKRWLAFCQLESIEPNHATGSDVARWIEARRADAGAEGLRRDLQGLQALYAFLRVPTPGDPGVSTRAAAGEPVREYFASLSAGEPAPERSPWRIPEALASDPAFQALIAGFGSALLSSGLSRSTVASYSSPVAFLWRWAAGRDVRQLSRSDLDVWVWSRLQEAGQNTARRDLQGVRALYAWLKRSGQRPDDPADGMKIKREQVLPTRPFSEEDTWRLLQACTSSRDRLIFALLVSTGMRISEVAAMHAEDVQWRDGTGRILVHGKGSKQRYVAPPEHVISNLLAYLAGRETGWVWLADERFHEPGPISAQRIRKNLYALAQKAGVQGAHPHRFRATFATYYLKRGGGVDVLRVLMGHESIETTARYAFYANADDALESQRRLNVLAGSRAISSLQAG